MKLDDWQRIEKIVSWAGLSVNAFALNIGLGRSENLYRIRRGDNGISKELARAIAARYPEINPAWILTGEGDMFVGGSSERNAIPVYDVDAAFLAVTDVMPQPSHMISLPRVADVSFAAITTCRDMEPDIPCGATLLLSETSPDRIVPGYVYMVATSVGAFLRTVRKCDDGKLLLVASAAGFGDMEVSAADIKKIFAVRGYIRYNF